MKVNVAYGIAQLGAKVGIVDLDGHLFCFILCLACIDFVCSVRTFSPYYGWLAASKANFIGGRHDGATC